MPTFVPISASSDKAFDALLVSIGEDTVNSLVSSNTSIVKSDELVLPSVLKASTVIVWFCDAS